MATTAETSQRERTQALCWLLDEVLDAEDDLQALAARPGALTDWRRERFAAFCQRLAAQLERQS